MEKIIEKPCRRTITRNTFINAGWYSIKDLERMIEGVKAKRKGIYQYVRYQDG